MSMPYLYSEGVTWYYFADLDENKRSFCMPAEESEYFSGMLTKNERFTLRGSEKDNLTVVLPSEFLT